MLRIATLLECEKLSLPERFAIAYLYDLRDLSGKVAKYKIKINIDKQISDLTEKGLLKSSFGKYEVVMKNIIEIVRK